MKRDIDRLIVKPLPCFFNGVTVTYSVDCCQRIPLVANGLAGAVTNDCLAVA